MTNYNVDLTPQLINLASEGSMDTSILNGKSLQRTFSNLLIENENQRKIVGRLADGSSFNDTIETVSDYGNLTAEETPAWVRPAEWLALPSVENEQRFAGLFGIYPDGNFLAVSAEGNYTVNWGDGNVENFDSGDTAYHEYTYGDISDLNEDVLGYRQVVVQIYPQAGQNLTALNIVEDHNQAGLNDYYVVPWLDVLINAENLSSLVLIPNEIDNYNSNGMISCTILDNNIVDASYLFYRCRFLLSVSFNASNVTNMNSMFNECLSLTSVSLFDTSNVTSMYRMFINCLALTSVSLFDTSNVTNMYQMFRQCYALTSVPLFDTSNVTNMEGMLSQCYALTSVSLFDTSNVTNMSEMFYGCYSLTSVPLFDTSNVTDMIGMFGDCYSLTSVPLFDTSNVTSMRYMFDYARKLTNVPLFDTSNVTNMEGMFRYSDLRNVPFFDTSNVTNANQMFNNCSSLTVGALNGTSVNISYADCKLSATQLNAIYTGLATVSGKTITVTGNYGTASDNPTIATAKGWTVTS